MTGDPDLVSRARACLREPDPLRKCALTHDSARAFREGRLPLDGHPGAPLDEPGRPERPALIAARDLPQRGLGSAEGRAAFIHAIAHIEFNAINLAWDAVQRFVDMPAAFYADWVRVADDEARHFGWLQARLHALGHAYGDFAAHDGLWEMARRSAHDCLARMALVPRLLEARGLDVTPGMIARLERAGDAETARILAAILDEEVAHVAAGSRWFHWCCARAGRDPDTTFAGLLRGCAPGAIRPPFNHSARHAAGFSAHEIELLEHWHD